MVQLLLTTKYAIMIEGFLNFEIFQAVKSVFYRIEIFSSQLNGTDCLALIPLAPLSTHSSTVLHLLTFFSLKIFFRLSVPRFGALSDLDAHPHRKLVQNHTEKT